MRRCPKKKKVTTKSGQVQFRSDAALFVRFAVLAQQRSMDMAKALSYPLGPLPWPLANAGGSLSKTNKAKLMLLLEDGSEPLEKVPSSAAWIINGTPLM